MNESKPTECPRCGELRPNDLNEDGLYAGPRCYHRADREEDDIFICLGCGHLFHRNGKPAKPGKYTNLLTTL